MDPTISAIVGALVAGATAAASGVASDVVKDAYQGLRKILVDVYNVASTSLLEKMPTNDSFQEAVRAEIEQTPAIPEDGDVLIKVKAVQDALKQEPPTQLTAWGIDIGEIVAAGNVIAEQISGSGGGFRAGKVTSGGNVELRNISGGGNVPGKQ